MLKVRVLRKKSRDLQAKDFEFVGHYGTSDVSIRLEDPITPLDASLGPPLRTEVHPNGSDPKWDVINQHYDGLLVGTIRHWRDVRYVEVHIPQLKTYRGIRVGDSKQKVLQAYGAAREAGSDLVYYYKIPPDNTPGWEPKSYVLFFSIEDGKVAIITMHVGDN